MSRKFVLCLCALLAFLVPAALPAAQAVEGEGDAYLLAALQDWNGVLRAEWMDLRAQQVDVLGKGKGKASARLYRQPFRWVAGDPRRGAAGTGMTYRVDTADLAASGLDPAEAEAAIDRAMGAWTSGKCFKKAGFAKRPATGADADIFDFAYGYGGYGDYKAADIVHAGFLPSEFFEQVAGPGGGETVVALSVTFIYVDAEGQPTDADGDGYLDTAHNEVYYNQAFSWTDGGMDLETVALHEIGHSLGLSHVDPPPLAVMNPVYAGLKRALYRPDHSALCSIWSSWPH
jgi:hypothetical protein